MNRKSFTAGTVASTLALHARPAGAQAAPYKVGCTWPLTGPIAAVAAENLDGLRVAEAEINKAGGVKGRRIQVLAEDSAATPQVGLAAMRKLIQVDNVHVVVSALTNVVSAQVPLAESLRTPLMTIMETPGLLDKTTYSFAHAPTWGIIVPLFVKDWKARGVKRVFGLMLNNALGQAEGPALRAAAQEAGAEYAEVYIEPDATDFRGVLERVRSFDADAVAIPGQGGQSEMNAVRQLREMTLKPRVYALGQVYTGRVVQSVIGPYAEGMIFGGLYLDPKLDRARDLVTAFKEKTSFVPSTQAAEMYDVLHMIADGIAKNGDDAAGLQRYFADLKGFPSVFGGTVDMGANHRTVIKAIGLFQVKSGSLARIA
jgi:branched-chain amino acid transport system substrate-binding protein